MTYLQKTLQRAEVDFDNDRTAALVKKAFRILSDFKVVEFRQSTVKATLNEPQATQQSTPKYVSSSQAPRDASLDEPAPNMDSADKPSESDHHAQNSENEPQGSSMPEVLETESEPRSKLIVTLKTKQPTALGLGPAADTHALSGDATVAQTTESQSSSNDGEDVMPKSEPSCTATTIVEDISAGSQDVESPKDESYDAKSIEIPVSDFQSLNGSTIPDTLTPQSIPNATNTPQGEIPLNAGESSIDETYSDSQLTSEERKASMVSEVECSGKPDKKMSSANENVDRDDEDTADQVDQQAPKSQIASAPVATEVQEDAKKVPNEACTAEVDVDGTADKAAKSSETPELAKAPIVIDDHVNDDAHGLPVQEDVEKTSEQDKSHGIQSSQEFFIPEEEGDGLSHIFPVACDGEGMSSVKPADQKLVFLDGTLTNLGPAEQDQDVEESAKVAGNTGTTGEPLEEADKDVADITASKAPKPDESEQQLQENEAPEQHYIPIEEGSGLSHVFVGSDSQPAKTGVPVMVDDNLTNFRVEDKPQEKNPTTTNIVQKVQVQEQAEVIVQSFTDEGSATTLVTQKTQSTKEIIPDRGSEPSTIPDVPQFPVSTAEVASSTDGSAKLIIAKTTEQGPADQIEPVTPKHVSKKIEQMMETSTLSSPESMTTPSKEVTDSQEASLKVTKYPKQDAGKNVDPSASTTVRVPSAESSATTVPQSRNVSDSSNKTTITTPESDLASSQPSTNAQPAAGGRKGRKRGGKKNAAKKNSSPANDGAAKEQLEPAAVPLPQAMPTNEATKKRNAQRRRAKKARKQEKESGNLKEEGAQKEQAGSAPGAWPAS